jgi:hypothetical protein
MRECDCRGPATIQHLPNYLKWWFDVHTAPFSEPLVLDFVPLPLQLPLSFHSLRTMASSPQIEPEIVDDGPPISVPDTGDAGESGKLKMIIQLVRKCMGIKDIASMLVTNDSIHLALTDSGLRWQAAITTSLFVGTCTKLGGSPTSLPPTVLMNVYYRNTGTTWTDPISLPRMHLIVPFVIIAAESSHRINDSEDPFERMLAVLRFTFSKDLKFIVSSAYHSSFTTLSTLLKARQSLQALQLCSGRTLPSTLGYCSRFLLFQPPCSPHSTPERLRPYHSSERDRSYRNGEYQELQEWAKLPILFRTLHTREEYTRYLP